MKIKLLISYKGTHFFGWQKQAKGKTIQSEIESALSQIFKQDISVTGSGRTDTGVHALGQVAHFEIDEKQLKNINLISACNHYLPEDISILEAWVVPDEFHARFSAVKKTYQYFIFSSESRSALFHDFAWHISHPLCLKKLNKMARLFKGKKDFTSFQNQGSDPQTTIKTIYSSKWMKVSESLYCYEVIGSGFLKQMVRNMVGTQIDLLKQNLSPEQIKTILASQDRKAALGKAPSKGLYLKQVFYPSDLEKASHILINLSS